MLAAELHGLSADAAAPGQGLVIEAHVDPKRGSTATLLVRDGRIHNGEVVVAGAATAPVRIMENFAGKPIKEALPGSPVRIIGFSVLPAVGAHFSIVQSKKEAEALVSASRSSIPSATALRAARPESPVATGDTAPEASDEVEVLVLPIVIKTDVAGTGEAVMHELDKLSQDPRLEVRIVARGVGAVAENDVKLVGGGKTPGIILGFNVKVEREARDMAERLGVEIAVFDIIYKLAEWLGEALAKRRPRQATDTLSGGARVLKVFSTQKGKVVLGGRVDEGKLAQGAEVRIMRRDAEVGRGTVVGLQSNKKDVRAIEAGSEFGAMIKTTCEPAANDRLESFEVIYT